ncbi:SDR family NAD(P)-dependent oxidoreductase [Candidatus Parabeggiatoa sp. HSG14]|uniref:SDR family NAD(P)-dependent oxidoreductase n=1 Tax=Candidatus Parabeggiatoa sp. HSG14 TaxID=3055593 RepID=UPI0025A891D1|nr:SDR family NAD(P)-dependent oxidoreductase [Thiotrichales bacterium HSG14]
MQSISYKPRKLPESQNIKATLLPVSHAFHSKLMEPAAEILAAHLAQIPLQPLQQRVISTITGMELKREDDLKILLKQQMTSSVRFTEAVNIALQETDLFLEVGPGEMLTSLVRQMTDVPVIPLDVAGQSLQGFLSAIGAAYVLGTPVNREALFADRFTRPFSLDWQPKFFVNPCELAPQLEDSGILDISSSERTIASSNVLETAITADIPQKSEPVENKSINVLERLRNLVAERADFPSSAIQNNSRLLADLHLNSIAVGQIVSEVGQQIGLQAPADPTAYADASLEQIAHAMEERMSSGEVEKEPLPALPVGIDAWIRPFTVEWVECSLPQKSSTLKGNGNWQVFGHYEYQLKAQLEQRLNEWGESGVALCLLEEVNETHIGMILEATKTLFNKDKYTKQHFVLVQHSTSVAAFARTLHREHPDITTCTITLPFDDNAIERILTEVQMANEYHEVYYDIESIRHERVLKQLKAESKVEQPHILTPDDILLVTGGGKGITAECAAALAQDSGTRLVLLGRASPEKDAELSNNLARFQKMGIDFKYYQTDITDVEAVKKTVTEITDEWGAITAILHGAGTNQPTLIRNLEETAFQQTLAPKVAGLRNLLAAVNPKQLRLLVSFGSIIATTGMPGEADYAVANEWLAAMTTHFKNEYPNCRCLTLEWTIWSGIGMGKRLGSDEILAQQGITPISPDVGIEVLRQTLAEKKWPSTVVVTGRMPSVLTLRMERPDMPFFRFLEKPRVYYPGIELIVEAEISLTADPYLNDHVYEGERLFPAVMGLEAMAQVASAVLGTKEVLAFENIEFPRPVVVEKTKSETLQIAALVSNDGKVDVVLRCANTGFKVDHFRARCLFEEELSAYPHLQDEKVNHREASKNASRTLQELQKIEDSLKKQTVQFNPEQELYGSLLFQENRFKRLRAYHHIEATQCTSNIAADDSVVWFGRYLSPELILGDPGSRDATIHGIQVCTPHAQLLPVGVDRINFINAQNAGSWTVSAKERWRKGDLFCYDLTVQGQNGELWETWEGLRLQKVSPITWKNGWLIPLLAPYLERQIQELMPEISLHVVISQDSSERESCSDKAIKMLLGTNTELVHRPDGKPEVPNSDMNVSISHVGDLTLAVAGIMSIACDLEPVIKREAQTWEDLLGIHRDLVDIISQETGENNDKAATRIWTARECLKKMGTTLDTPLTIKSCETKGWILLNAGDMTLCSSVVSVKTSDTPLAIAVLIGKE